MYEGYKIARGYVLVRLDPKIKKVEAFDLPEEERVNRGEVILSGDRPGLLARLLGARAFVRKGDRVVVGQIRQEIDREHVVCHIDHLLVKE